MQSRLVALLVLLGVAVAAPTTAATTWTIGQTGSNAQFDCASPSYTATYLQRQTNPDDEPPVSYAVPAGGAVITSWSTDGSYSPGGTVQLKVLRGSGLTFEAIGESVVELPQALMTYKVQIPVDPGDVLGLTIPVNSPYQCIQGSGSQGDITSWWPIDLAVGSTQQFMDRKGVSRLNVAATVESDTDEDGFGDETQDGCATDPTRVRTGCSAVPRIFALAVASRPAAGSAARRSSARTPTASFLLSRRARVRFVVERRLRGRWERVPGTFSRRLRAGRRSVRLRHELGEARYRLRARPVSGGRVGREARTTFRLR
jgi:hypothetical protein